MSTITPTLATLPRFTVSDKIALPPNVTVTYDPKQDCYDYEAPGYHRQVSRLSPLKEGVTGAALVGVPSLVGAAEHALLGAGASTLVSLALSPTAGAVLGAVIVGGAAWKETNRNPFFTGLAALAGAGVGAVAWPLLKLPGVWGGLTGALVATGVAAGGAASRAIGYNAREDALAREHGCSRP